MKVIFVLMLLGFLSVQSRGQHNPVIVELFTSQGCSSCPAADQNLTEIIQEADHADRPVYALSFHVDYWNYIGWKDPYSSKEFTARQRLYAQTLNLQTIYTPQLIVNGEFEFVGSDKTTSRRLIEQETKVSPKYHINISNVKVSGQSVTLTYAIDKQPANEVLNIAVVEKNAENFVSRGENKSRTLHHDNVVRAFKTIDLKQSNEVTLEIPAMTRTNGSVILYIQDQKMRVLASASVLINN